jgi:hypothetical protein
MFQFGLVEALMGRRSRRFPMGAEIPDGALAYASEHEAVPLTELERAFVLTAMAGNTGWNFAIPHNAFYAPHLPNYALAAGGRTFPSAAGFHTSQLFFTDDSGTYFFDTRDAPDLRPEDSSDLDALLDAHRPRIRKLGDERVNLPPDIAVEGHNVWVANHPGSLLVFPVADLAQHQIANLCYCLQNGFVLTDDVHGQPIPGTERFAHLTAGNEPLPLSWIEMYALCESIAEMSASCYAGALTLQAMGLGGWMFNGINPIAILGASGDPDVPGLGFRYDEDEGWATPNPTGLDGVFEGFCPPHFPDLRAAVDALCDRKFGQGGPFHPDTPGAWTDSPKVRGAAQVHSEEFRECVALQAQYTFDRFGKFPGTVPSVFTFVYLQAHHLDLGFYDRHFAPGAYLETHRRHMERWHPDAAD